MRAPSTPSCGSARRLRATRSRRSRRSSACGFRTTCRALLERAGGIDGGPLETIDFTGASFDVEIRDIFPSGLPIAHDGSGNHWVLDLTPDAVPPLVFFASHDPPVILVQSPDLAHFLDEVFGDPLPSRKSLVHEDRLFHVWRENPGELDHAAALTGDEELRAFAATLDDRYTVVDLRTPRSGRASRGDAMDRQPRSDAATGGSSPTPHRNRSRKAVCWAGSSGSPDPPGRACFSPVLS